MLVAPSGYVGSVSSSANHFDTIITYEDIAAAIELDPTPRSAHRAALLRRAVQEARAAYSMVPVVEVGSLWNRIYAIARNEFPILEMKPPSEKGGQSKWIIFKSNLPAKITIDWKITKPTVELSFWPGSRHRPFPQVDLSKLRGASLHQAPGGTSAIVIPAPRPPADWTNMPAADIRCALAIACDLLRFYHDHASALE